MAKKAQKTLTLMTSRVPGPGGSALARGTIVKASNDYAQELIDAKRARVASPAEIARVTLIPELVRP